STNIPMISATRPFRDFSYAFRVAGSQIRRITPTIKSDPINLAVKPRYRKVTCSGVLRGRAGRSFVRALLLAIHAREFRILLGLIVIGLDLLDVGSGNFRNTGVQLHSRFLIALPSNHEWATVGTRDLYMFRRLVDAAV